MNGSGLGWVSFCAFLIFHFTLQSFCEKCWALRASRPQVKEYGGDLSWLRKVWLLPPSLPPLSLWFGVRFLREQETAFGEEEYPGGRKLPVAKSV